MNVKCALIQLAFRKGVDNALAAAEEKIAEAAANGAGLVVLPEMFCCPYSTKKFPEYAQPEDGEICTRMARAAREHGIYLVAGTIPELVRTEQTECGGPAGNAEQPAEGGPAGSAAPTESAAKIYNTAFVYGPDGHELCRHRKIHMFDVEVEGGVSMRESDTLAAGDRITCFDTTFGRV